jgi:hypothetical protein
MSKKTFTVMIMDDETGRAPDLVERQLSDLAVS